MLGVNENKMNDTQILQRKSKSGALKMSSRLNIWIRDGRHNAANSNGGKKPIQSEKAAHQSLFAFSLK